MSHIRYLVTVLATLSVFTSSGSLAKVVDSSAAGFTIENTVIVPADADTAWIALVNHVDEWWPKDHSWFGKAGKFSIDARAGGCFCEVVDKQQQAMHMTVSMVVAGVKLRMLGGLGPLQGMGVSGAMDWKFDPAEGGTRITDRNTMMPMTTPVMAARGAPDRGAGDRRAARARSETSGRR